MFILISGVVTDGADVMKSFSNFLKEEFQKNEFVWHYCPAHRIERILHHAKRIHPNFESVERNVNQLASFYRQSHKRTSHFMDYLAALAKIKDPNGKPKLFRLAKIFKIRFVNSAFEAYVKLIRNWKPVVKHLKEVQNPTDLLPNPKFDKKTKKKAKKLEKFARDKNALLTTMVTTDVVEVLKKGSLIFQTKGASMVGQFEIEKALKKELYELKKNKGGHWMKKFLRRCKCQKTKFILTAGGMQKKISRRKERCMNLEKYEQSHVTWKGIVLLEGSKFKPLSSFVDDFLDKMLEVTNFYMPEGQDLVQHVSIFNHQSWPSKLRDLERSADEYETSIGFLVNKFNMIDDLDSIIQSWKNFLQTIFGDEEYFFKIKLLNPTAFWVHIMGHYDLEPPFKRFDFSI